jgi:hypothetical protein
MSLLVYVLAARGAQPARLRGVRGERLQSLRIGSIDVLVGAMPTPPRATVRTLREYDRVVRALWASRAAVLPARFPSLVADPSELERTVRPRQATFRRHLRFLRHRAQMIVRLVPASGTRDHAPRLSPRGRFRGSKYLAQRARAARLEHIPEIGVVRDAVRRWVRAERVEARAGVATIYHLVPRTAVPRYRDAVERAAAAAGLRLQVTGPWPAYAFAEPW